MKIFHYYLCRQLKGGGMEIKMKEIHELYEKYYTTVMRYALSLTRNYHLAEDITQEAFLKAILSIHKFKGECKVSVWLCQIVKNLYFDECRKRKLGQCIVKVSHGQE